MILTARRRIANRYEVVFNLNLFLRFVPDSGQVRVGYGKGMFALNLTYARDPKHTAKLIRGDFHGTWRRSLTGLGLRKGSRGGRMKRDVAFDLLHDLMDVAVQD